MTRLLDDVRTSRRVDDAQAHLPERVGRQRSERATDRHVIRKNAAIERARARGIADRRRGRRRNDPSVEGEALELPSDDDTRGRARNDCRRLLGFVLGFGSRTAGGEQERE
jgi:hypothetical protein